MGLDTNHGYAKRAVINSEIAKRRAALEQRLATLRRWTDSACVRYQHAEVLSDRLRKQANARGEILYRCLNERMFALEGQGIADHLVRREIKERKATIDAELQGLWQRIYRVEARIGASRNVIAANSVKCCERWRTWPARNERCLSWTIVKIRS